MCDPATLEDGTPVPPSELARIMYDCDITRIVIDAEGAPLDLGRTRRLFSGPQRRAVIARDRECIWPGCHAPARWCEIHHLRWWERDGGPTSVDLGGLICSFHHHETHRRDLVITRHADPSDDRTTRRRRAADLTRVRYEFRDATGRLVGPAPPGSGTARLRPAAGDPVVVRRPSDGGPEPGPGGRVDHAVARDGSPVTGGTVGGAETGREPPDGLDLEWATDPVTGVRVPAFLLGVTQ